MAIKDRITDFKDKRIEKRNEKRNDEYNEWHPEINAAADQRFANLLTEAPEFISNRTTEAQARITELGSKSELSDDEKGEKAKLEAEVAHFGTLGNLDHQMNYYVDYRVEETRNKYAEQLAARTDNTVNIKEGTSSQVNAAHEEWLIATGVKFRKETEGITDNTRLREEHLKLLLGTPGTDEDGLKGDLIKETANQRKLNSKFYDAKTDAATGAVTVERNEKGKIRQAFGETWRKWSKEGFKGKMKKALAGVAGGLVLGALGGAVGASLAVAGIAAGTVRVLKAAGTHRLERTGNLSSADEDAEAQLEQLRLERDNVHAVDDSTDLDRTLWESRDRANDINRTHKRTTGIMAAASLVGGTTGAGVVGRLMEGTSLTGLAGKGVEKGVEGVKSGWNSVFGEDTVQAAAGEVNPPAPGTTGTGAPTGEVNSPAAGNNNDPTGDVNKPADRGGNTAATGEINPPASGNGSEVSHDHDTGTAADTDNDPATNSTPEAFSEGARKIEKGDGWFRQFQKMDIPAAERPALLKEVGPELERLGVAYKMPNGQYGMLETPIGGEKGVMPQAALEAIVNARATK